MSATEEKPKTDDSGGGAGNEKPATDPSLTDGGDGAEKAPADPAPNADGAEKQAPTDNGDTAAAADGGDAATEDPAKAEEEKEAEPTEEHEYVGRRIARSFPEFKEIFFGKVALFKPPDLWHIVYDDDDSQDMEEDEIRRAFRLYERKKYRDPTLAPPPKETEEEKKDGEKAAEASAEAEAPKEGEKPAETPNEEGEKPADDAAAVANGEAKASETPKDDAMETDKEGAEAKDAPASTEETKETKEEPKLEKCDICLYGDGHAGFALLKCLTCKVCVHRECYGMQTYTQKEFVCWACDAVGKEIPHAPFQEPMPPFRCKVAKPAKEEEKVDDAEETKDAEMTDAAPAEGEDKKEEAADTAAEEDNKDGEAAADQKEAPVSTETKDVEIATPEQGEKKARRGRKSKEVMKEEAKREKEESAVEEKLKMLQTERPSHCALCNYQNEGEVHAMHPLYDNHGPNARQRVIKDKDGNLQLAWAHTLCAFLLSENNVLYGVQANGTTHEGMIADASDKRPLNPFLQEEDEKILDDVDYGEFAPMHHFVYFTKRPRDKQPRKDVTKALKLISEMQAEPCDICKKATVYGLEIPIQCSANDKHEYKNFRGTHEATLKGGECCLVPMHVGCAMWGPNEHTTVARRVFFFPGSSTLDPVKVSYCSVHAVDITKKHRLMMEKEEKKASKKKRDARKKAMKRKVGATTLGDEKSPPKKKLKKITTKSKRGRKPKSK